MIKNISKIRILNTFIMCFFVFAMFFNSVHDIFRIFNIENIEVVDANKSEKEIDEKIEFEDEFVKTIFTHYFNTTQSEKQKFHKPAAEFSSVNQRILIPPPRYS